MPKLKCSYRKLQQVADKKIGTGVRTREWQYEIFIDGKFQFKVTVPEAHGPDSELIPQGTLLSIMRQLKLGRADFQKWLDCPIGPEEYETIIRQVLGL